MPNDPSEDQRDNPGVIAPPPLIILGFLAAGFALDWAWPAAMLPEAPRYALGLVFAAAGIAVAVAASRQFRAAGTNAMPHKPTTAILTTGPFAYSRNPLYLSLSTFHAAIAVAADNPWALALLAPALVVIRYGVIAREERYLEAKFGDEYRAYKTRVRRWL